ncbi:flavodoxin family protein [Desulfoluna limicola]|uniref:Flavodoxin family protein n=1 Tax=Desulfoluna limicola TaxID=2810562 RepID=A0ABM7PC61_9BACT|nr:flavodoxin family protein [Desulfoluna limicola]BCS95247.1 flavodoxin family protein [Desulfoluna limicola]
MKVVAFNGSPRKNGNTSILIKTVCKELEKEGIETELVTLGGSSLRGCMACFKCFERSDGTCVIESDMVNECVAKMREADGIILGSPAYFANVTTEMKALIDRAGLVAMANPGMLRHKVGAAVAVARRVGAMQVFQQLNTFFSCFEMFTAGSIYPNMALGEGVGDVESDTMGLEIMATLGRNMALLIKKVKS